MLIACGSAESGTEGASHGTVVVDNLHPKYPRSSFTPVKNRLQYSDPNSDPAEEVNDLEPWSLEIDTSHLRWESYIKAGYHVGSIPHAGDASLKPCILQGILQHYYSGYGVDGSEYPVAVNLLVTGTVPAGSGLSSSAALVVASTLAFLAVNGKVA